MKQTQLPRILRSATILTAILALAGCAASSPPVDFYTLAPMESPAEPPPPRSGLTLGVGPVRIPEYLDRPQIVTRTSMTRLSVDEFHRWGGSLSEEFLRTLGENLVILLNTDRVLLFPQDERIPVDYRVWIGVQRFDGTLDKETVLNVRWAILRPRDSEALVLRQSTIRVPAPKPGYEGLALASSKAIESLSREIAEAVKKLESAQK